MGLSATQLIHQLHPPTPGVLVSGARQRFEEGQQLGLLFHEAVAEALRRRVGIGNRLPGQLGLEQGLAELWKAGDRLGLDEGFARWGLAELMVERFVRGLKRVGELLALPGEARVEGIEKRVIFKWLGVECVFDLVLRVGDVLCIVDYKTGTTWGGGFSRDGKPILDARTQLQMDLYQLASLEMVGEGKEARLYIYDARKAAYLRMPTLSSAQQYRIRTMLRRALEA